MSASEKRLETRPALLILAVVVISSLGVLAAACGGDSSEASPLETFFESVKQVIDDADAEADEVEAGMDAGLSVAEDFESLLDVLEGGVHGFQQLASGAHDDLENIDAPAEIADLHGEFVAIFGTAADALEDIEADLAGIDPSADEDKLFDQISEFGADISEEFGALGTQSNAVCSQLQDIADENDIDVDLECGAPD